MTTFLIAAAIAVSPAGAAGGQPTVRLLDESPVSIAGTGFKARERVTVRVNITGRGSVSKIVRATAAGRFSAVFAQQTISECVTFSVVAVGGQGSRASVKRINPPAPCGSVESP